MSDIVKYNSASKGEMKSLGLMIPRQLSEEISHSLHKLKEALGGDVAGFVANRLQFSPEELAQALAAEQVDGVALAIYNIEARAQSVIIGDQTGIGKGRQAAAMIRYGLLAGYLPVFLTDRYTLFSDMYRDCKALGIKDARPLVLNQKVSVVDFDHIVEDKDAREKDEIWTPDEDDEDGQKQMSIYQHQYEEVYKSPKKAELELMYKKGDIEESRFEYLMLTYSQLKDARRDRTRLEFLASLCKKHRVLFIFDEAHKSSSVSAGKISVITQAINYILDESPQTQCLFLSATFAKRPECMITFMRQTMLSSLATNDTLKKAFANGGVPMQEYVASQLAYEGQMIRREHSLEGMPEPAYTYLDEKFERHSELFDKVMYWYREIVKFSDMVKKFLTGYCLLTSDEIRPYPARAQLFYVNKILLLALKAADVAEAAVRDVQAGKSVVIAMSDTLECVLRDSLDPHTGECGTGDFSTILLRLLDKTVAISKTEKETLFDLDMLLVPQGHDLFLQLQELKITYGQIIAGIRDEKFHLPMSPIDVIRQLITKEEFKDKSGVVRNIRFEECTGRAHQLEYFSPEGDDDYLKVKVVSRKKRHSNHIYNDFQNNKLDVILINACGAIGASAHATVTGEVAEEDVRQRKMLIVQNDLDVNIDLQKRGRINRTGQVGALPPLYEYIITAIPSEKRLNMMLRAKLRSLSANTAANQDQDRRQADFIDISNKYGNQVTKEYLQNNPELVFSLGLAKSATAAQLLARIAMLSVHDQQTIIDEIFSSYQNLEQELRRINQWDLEREYRDFEAEFVSEELFTTSIDETALGGGSMLSTFRCRHRTYPYDSKSLLLEVAKGKEPYGERPAESDQLRKEISAYYRKENKKIRDKIKKRRSSLWKSALETLCKYIQDPQEAEEMLKMAQLPLQDWEDEGQKLASRHPKSGIIWKQLLKYNYDYLVLEEREDVELKAKSDQRKRMMKVLSKAVIGRTYANIIDVVPVEDYVERVMAVLKEVRFDKNEEFRFQPGRVQFVFALSAVHKELVLNLSNKGLHNNYSRLVELLDSPKMRFYPAIWDQEIAKYNNRILDRKIITGNILGAYANPLVEKIKPHFITFSLATDDDGEVHTEQGLLLPMSGANLNQLVSQVSLPLASGLKYANSPNYVYRISGIGIGASIIPTRYLQGDELTFVISIDDKDARKFESDSRFDSIRSYFKGIAISSMSGKTSSKKKIIDYHTKRLFFSDDEFIDIITLFASLKAMILIPREYFTVKQMREFAQARNKEEDSQWPALDWRKSAILPPARKEVKVRISAPEISNDDAHYVDEFSPIVLLAQHTLAFNNRLLNEKGLKVKLRSCYSEWCHWYYYVDYYHEDNIRDTANIISRDIHYILTSSKKQRTVSFGDEALEALTKLKESEVLSSYGKIVETFYNEYVLMSPPKEEVQEFLDNCICDPRLAELMQSLENYISGKTDVIHDIGSSNKRN